VWTTNQPHWLPDTLKDANFPRAKVAANDGLHGAFAFPIRVASGVIGVMEFFSREIRKPDQEILDLFDAIGSQLSQFVERLKAEAGLQAAHKETKQIEEQKDRLKEQKLYLEEEIRSEYFGDIVGESAALKASYSATKGAHYGRHRSKDRTIRACRPGNTVPRRDRRHSSRIATEAIAPSSGTRIRKARLKPHNQSRRSPHCCNESRIRHHAHSHALELAWEHSRT
jgi:hypothetical protein